MIAIGVVHVDHVRHERLERDPERGDAVDRQGAHRRPVVGDPARDRLPAALARDPLLDALARRHALRHLRPHVVAARRVVLARELPGRLDRLGAARHEEDAVQVAGRDGCDLGRELDRARVRIAPVRVEGKLAQLRGGGLADLVAEAVADVDGEKARERVEIALAVDVLEVAAVPAHDDRDVLARVARHAREMQPEVFPGGLLQLGGGHRCDGGAHTAPFG